MPKSFPPVLARLALLCVCLFAFASAPALAQSQATSGDIDGRVLDPNGAVVKGANVTARNNATGLERSATTDDEGNFRIILLPPGSYSVSAASSGFTTREVAGVQVTVGSRTTLDIPLAVGGARADVTVTGEAPVVETARTSVSTTINERAIQNLPINGRNFQDFSTLSPGVIRYPSGGVLSVGGQRGTLNSVQFDGVLINNTYF